MAQDLGTVVVAVSLLAILFPALAVVSFAVAVTLTVGSLW